MSSRVYVTGCAGMIGSNICRSLVTAGYDVVGIDNLWRGTKSNMEAFQASRSFTFRHADVASDMDWHRDVDADSVIIHAADIVGGIGFVFQNEWAVFQKNNLINTQIARLVQAAQPKKLIYLGTACSYPQGLQRSVESSVLKELDKFPASPESGYGWSKLLGDIEFNLAVKGTPTKLMVLDLHNVYGWPCVYDDNTAQVIPALIYKSITSPDRSLVIWGDGNQGRAFVHVSDVVQAVEKAVVYQGELSNFMIGPSFCTQIREVARIIREHPDVDIEKVVFDPAKPTGDIGRYANSALARNHLGWVPSIDLAEGIHDVIDHVIQHHHRKTGN